MKYRKEKRIMKWWRASKVKTWVKIEIAAQPFFYEDLRDYFNTRKKVT